jgi:hypothetical protein
MLVWSSNVKILILYCCQLKLTHSNAECLALENALSCGTQFHGKEDPWSSQEDQGVTSLSLAIRHTFPERVFAYHSVTATCHFSISNIVCTEGKAKKRREDKKRKKFFKLLKRLVTDPSTGMKDLQDENSRKSEFVGTDK